MKKIFVILMCILAINIDASAQTQQLRGTVVDTDGAPLIGATVVSTGTKIGTVTNLEGEFQLTGQTNSITVTYIGYETQTLNVSNRNDLKIVMKPNSKAIDAVVVVGYGTQKKATLTGAVSSVSGETLNKRSVASLSTALEGTMPGVTIQQTSGEPGADGANIHIRGIGSLNSTTYPLVLVDGIEMSMDQLDMSTVQSVSVLKDAASASIYGSRASNGVILITTKRGKSGKIRVAYSGYFTSQRPTNMPNTVGAADYLQAELDSWDNAGISITDETRTAREKMINDQRTLRPDNWDRYDTNWKSATISKSAPLQNHNITLSGGNDNLNYFGSISLLDQGGLIANNNYKRVNIRVNTDAKITSWLKLSNEIAYRHSTTLTPSVASPKSIINKALYMLPTLSAVKELDGNWGYGKNGDNPTAEAEAGGTVTNNSPQILLNATLTATPLEGLELQAQYSYLNSENRATSIIKPYTTSLKGVVNGTYPSLDGVSEGWSQNIQNNYRTQGSYAKKIGLHAAKILLGFQAQDELSSNFGASRTGFNDGRYYLNNGDGATSGNYGGASSWSMASFYGRLNYSFDEKYLVEFSGRYDGSSRFTTQNRWGFFPSVSAGWVISRESFMPFTSTFLDHLKLRGSYGTLGNQDIGTYPYASTINTGYSYWFDKQLNSGVAQTRLSNPNITWESSTQMDFGLDAYFLKQKLGFTFDYYQKNIYNMLQVFPLPYYVGLGSPWSNAGDMKNTGWETSLTYRDKIGNVNFSVTALLSDNQNTVTDLKGRTYTDHSIQVGYPKGGYWGYKTDGYYKDWDDVNNSPKLSNSARPGYVKYVKLDKSAGANPNLIQDGDRIYLGDPFPHFEYSLNLVARWKGFDMTVLFQGVGKRKMMLSGVGLKPFANGANLFTYQLDSWTPENQSAPYPILVPEANSADNFVTSDKWVQDASYLRLKNIVVGYTIQKKWLNKIGFDDARIYVSGQNLLTFSKFQKGYDPEVNYGGSVGGEFYPIMQTFTIGLNVNF